MDVKHKKNEAVKQQIAEELGSDNDADQSALQQGAEFCEQAREVAGDAYDKSAQAVSEAYVKAKNYGSKNPGKTMFLTLGIGVGLGFLLGVSSRRTGATARFARPVVNAISEVALEFFR